MRLIHLRLRCCLGLSLLLLLGAMPASATKIGFVEVERAIATIEQGKAALQKLDSWAQPRREVLAALGVERAHFQQQLQEQADAGNVEEVERLQEQLLDKGREIEDQQRNLARAYEAKRAELLGDVADRLNDVITKYAKENGYEAVFIMKDQMLLHLSGSAQLTDAVIKVYNERYPVTAE